MKSEQTTTATQTQESVKEIASARYGKVFHSMSADLVSVDIPTLTKRLTKELNAPVCINVVRNRVEFKVAGDPYKAIDVLKRVAPSLYPETAVSTQSQSQTVYAYYEDGLVMKLMGCNQLSAKMAKECRPGFKFFRGPSGKMLSKEVSALLENKF